MVALDEKLMEVLRCPACGSRTEHKDRRKAVVCLDGECSLQYPVVDGVPVMLVEESRKSRR